MEAAVDVDNLTGGGGEPVGEQRHHSLRGDHSVGGVLKNIALGYTLPKKWISKWGIDNLRVYVNIQNLLTITGYDGYDPEIGASTADINGYTYGLDNGRYPSPTTYSFGLNLTF